MPLQRLAHVFLLILLASRPSAPAVDSFGYFQSEQEFGEQQARVGISRRANLLLLVSLLTYIWLAERTQLDPVYRRLR